MISGSGSLSHGLVFQAIFYWEVLSGGSVSCGTCQVYCHDCYTTSHCAIYGGKNNFGLDARLIGQGEVLYKHSFNFFYLNP